MKLDGKCEAQRPEWSSDLKVLALQGLTDVLRKHKETSPQVSKTEE